MADVVIVLSLARKSGILAAAVSAISRAGLRFSTHRFVDAENGPMIRLNAESDAGFGDPRGVIDELSAIGGVAGVVDVVVDGRSLLDSGTEPRLPPEPEDRPAGEAAARIQFPAPAAPGHASTPASLPDTGPEPEPEFEPHPQPGPKARPDRDRQSAGESRPLRVADVGVPMRSSMIRRRRRRR